MLCKEDFSIERITGTIIGGATLIGLGKLLINEGRYEEIIKLAEKGNVSSLNIQIKDLYKDKDSPFDEDVLACSFGNLSDNFICSENKEDFALSLLTMICYHIGQLTYLSGVQTGQKRVLFLGNFTRKESKANELLNFATTFADKPFEVMFSTFDGLLGAIGCLEDE